jgi:protein gp37
MSERTAISWTSSTWNPIRGSLGNWHCIKVSPGCQNCYAARLNMRFGGPDYRVDYDTLRLDERALVKPLHWRTPRKIFVCSMTDLFEARVREDWIARIFQVMYDAPWHTYQVLTKRPERLTELARGGRVLAGLPDWPHIWCGTSIENDAYVWRADALREAPARIRFISAEPLLGPLPSLDLSGISWLISGGESGPDYRPMDPQWARDLRDACIRAGVAYWHKQGSGPRPGMDVLLDGQVWQQFPEVTA